MADDRPMGPLPSVRATPSSSSGAARPAEPCAMVVFGGTGDLMKRLVTPALYHLSRSGLLPEHFALIGVARAEETSESWRAALLDALKDYLGADPMDEAAWNRLTNGMAYVRGDLNRPELYESLRTALDAAVQAHGTRGNAIFHLAIADRLFGAVVEQLGKAKLTDQDEAPDGKRRFWRRVVIEKPFGHDLTSARALNQVVQRRLSEDQIFRIDHFLGKDTVQSIMAFRFANGLFEPIWNRDRIDHVQITAAESVGVEERGKFYEATGALRDMVPNHALALISLVAMEPPVGFDAAAIRNKKADVLAAMPAVAPDRAVRGQYGPGVLLGKAARGYRDEPNVAAESNAETYVALMFEVDNWRWAGVPFYFRTGKHLATKVTEIAIRFKQAPYAAFKDTPVAALRPNWMVLRIAPDEGISLQFEVKRRGPALDLAAVQMDFDYGDWFQKQPSVGYETLLYDVMTGDQTQFMRADMVEEGWRIVQPILEAWAAQTAEFPDYASGSEGPKTADALLTRDGDRAWRPIRQPLPKAPGADLAHATGDTK